MSASLECPDRATVETPRGDIVTAPVVECRTAAHAETGPVDYLVVEIDGHRLEYPASDATLPSP